MASWRSFAAVASSPVGDGALPTRPAFLPSRARMLALDEMASDEPIGGAGGVVFDRDGKVLVLRHASGAWVFPKGHLEPGEGPLQAALREVEEEAGVPASCRSPDRRWVTRYRNPRGERREIVWFRLETDATAPVMREALFPEAGFFPLTEALDRLSYESDRELLRQVASLRKEAA